MSDIDYNLLYNKIIKLTSEWLKSWGKQNKSGLSSMQILFMDFIVSKGGKCKPADFVKSYNITAGGVTGITNKLLELELIKKETEQHDKRAYIIKLTNKGIDVLKEIKQERTQMIKFVLQNLENQVFEIFNNNYDSVLNKIIQAGKRR